MGNKTLIFAIGLLVIISAGFFGYQQSKIPPKMQAGGPASFNFIFKYGIGGKNEVNTFQQTYTRETGAETPVVVKFQLSYSELTEIYEKINDLNLFYKETEPSKGNVFVTPCSNYYLKAYIDSTNKEIYWDDCRGKASTKLEEFSNFVISIIEDKEEYKKLPPPKEGYL